MEGLLQSRELLFTAAILLLTATSVFSVVLISRRHVREVKTQLARYLPAHPAREAPDWVLVGPIRELSFTQSLDAEKFGAAVEKHAALFLKERFDELNLAVDAARALRDVRQKTSLVVHVSRKGQKLLSEGKVTFAYDKTGNILPQLKDANGRVVEILKGGPGSVGRLAQLSAVVVGAAHAISSADLAKELKTVNTKLDKILEFRRVDQAASLERIYASARELLVGGRSETTELEIWRLRGELRQLRSSWRRELSSQLKAIDDPAKANVLARWFTRTSAVDSRVGGQISEGGLQLSLLEYSLRLDQALAIAAEQWDMAQATLDKEMEEIAAVRDILASKVKYISPGSDVAAEAGRMLDGVDELISSYRLAAKSVVLIDAAAIDRPRIVSTA